MILCYEQYQLVKNQTSLDSRNPHDLMIYKVPKHHLTFIFFGETLSIFQEVSNSVNFSFTDGKSSHAIITLQVKSQKVL